LLLLSYWKFLCSVSDSILLPSGITTKKNTANTAIRVVCICGKTLMTNKLSLSIFSLFIALQVHSQDSTGAPKKNIDPSKPTNLYTQVNLNLEYQHGKQKNLYGTRVTVQYAVNPDNLFLIELPFLYNDVTSKFGVGDMRIRYFNAIKRNITKSFIAIAPFADISAPTGSYKNGLGTSSWSLGAGVVFGFVVSKKLSLFPGINYLHITKPNSDLISEANKFNSNGVGFQFNASYVINKQTFLFLNPIPVFINTNGNWQSSWTAECSFNRIIVPNKFKMNAGWYPNFTADVNTFRLGGTFFL
jgi:hypothetical protein